MTNTQHPTPARPTVEAVRAWRAFDLITAADETRQPELAWDQHSYRTECGTGCCYAGHLAIDNGGVWLITITPDAMLIDGTPIDPTALDTDHDPWQYLIAEPADPEHAIEETHGKRVIHVSARADRLLGLSSAEHILYDGSNTRPKLEELITRRFGPRPMLVGAHANEGS
ncbi:hypothetical protein FXF51_01520 [Nonomuraea sp. PA05]|uniref:hypothetical protein n=1 Tax=Nonomuraea sp. PA05 TaxID=2604466 RepID=UPI0011D5AFE4|nr:hypothetical protein [Nonomuraea sp. PA05]TYB71140.1 hypothetical protein FXF51_01520 [Nonomuraea sp. PA05]